MSDILELQRDIHKNSIDHGFWQASQNIGEKLMLAVSELGGALEEYRDDNMTIRLEGDKPEGFPIELADCAIRIMDLCGWLGIDLAAAIEMKMAYNATRPKLHGRRL